MDLLKNHSFCNKPFLEIFDEFGKIEPYRSSYMVSIEMFPDYPTKHSLRTTGIHEDFENLIDYDVFFFNEKRYQRLISKFGEEKAKKLAENNLTNRLKPHVIEWLEKNVKNRTDKCHTQGFCFGNDDYNSESIEFNIFFHRKNDALNFIKTFSIHKKPSFIFDYFDEKRMALKPDGSYENI